MATIGTTSHSGLTNVPRRSYIAMNSYTSDLFGYSLTFNPTTFTNVGTLSNLGVPSSSTLQGSILSETGKKLYPGASDGVSTLMVSVYDQTSKVTGFINPNSPTFAIFNTDKPSYMGQGVDPTTSISNLGNSIYTHGSVIADGFGTYAGLLSTGQMLTTGTGVTSISGQNRVTNISTYSLVGTGGSVSADLEGGQVMTINLSSPTRSGSGTIHVFDSLGVNQSTINGSVAYMILSNMNTAVGSTFAVTFGNNLRETASLTISPSSTYTVSFVAAAGTMLEIARAGPILPG